MLTKNVRELVVKAVGKVIACGGLANMTIDAVSKEAGVSKGGVLHYFPSKQHLLLAMLDDFARRFYERRDTIAATLPDKKKPHAQSHHHDIASQLEYDTGKRPQLGVSPG